MVGYCAFTWTALGLLAVSTPLGAWLIGSYFRRKTRQAWAECEAEISKARLDLQDDFKENMHYLQGATNNLHAWQDSLEQRERRQNVRYSKPYPMVSVCTLCKKTFDSGIAPPCDRPGCPATLRS